MMTGKLDTQNHGSLMVSNIYQLYHSLIFVYATACKANIGGVLGVKEAMVAHILGKGGNNPCPNSSSEARKTARQVKKGKAKREREDSEAASENEDDGEKRVKRRLLTDVEATLKQSRLKVFRGIQVPFTREQEEVVHEQFLRATISANLPFRWVEAPEVILLFLLFRASAGDVMPSRQQIAGQLLDNANAGVTKRLKKVLRGEYAVLASDGWKDESRDSVNSVNLSVSGKVRYFFSWPCSKTHYKPLDISH